MISNPHPIAFQLSFYCLAQAVLRPSTTHGNAFHIGIQGISITLTWPIYPPCKAFPSLRLGIVIIAIPAKMPASPSF